MSSTRNTSISTLSLTDLINLPEFIDKVRNITIKTSESVIASKAVIVESFAELNPLNASVKRYFNFNVVLI